MVDSLRIHSCQCLSCQQSPHGEVAKDHQAINRILVSLNERARRLFAGLLARERGHGGVVEVASITGMSRTTVRRGMRELDRAIPEVAGRVRRPGGGRKRVEKKSPASYRRCKRPSEMPRPATR